MDVEEPLPRMLSSRYRLDAAVGHGGMGVVYRGTDLMMKRPVAVKLIRGVDGSDLDDEVAGRFLREAKNTARIRHEHIIEVYDLGRSERGDLYMVMELLEGESLSVRLRREGRLVPEVTVHIARQICDALEVAHAAGIIHRDLKPANVMLVNRAGDDSFVKVLDFGVAKSYSPDQQTQLTHTGMLVGTVEYMAPEQIMGKVVDGRTDMYSLGVVMYRMLLGHPPFKDGGVPAMIHAHLNRMPKPLHEQVAEIPGELDRIVLRCLAKRPDRRYESMGELSRALTTALEPEGVGLMSLDYGSSSEEDPYETGDQTKVGRPAPESLLPDLSGRDSAGPYEAATMKMDRRSPDSLPSQHASAPSSFDETTLLARDELSGAKRPGPENLPRPAAPRTVRHAAPRIPPPASGAYQAPVQGAPYAPPDFRPPQPQPQPQPQAGPRPHYASTSFPVGGHPQGPPPPPGPAPRPASFWERFLTWTGLRR